MSRRGRTFAWGAAVAIAGLGWASPARADIALGVENGLSYTLDSVPIFIGQPAAPTADCPAGQSVVGGGADAVSDQDGGVLASLTPDDGPDADTKLDDAFTAYAYNSTAVAGSAKVWAICAPGKTKYAEVTKPVSVNKTVALHAACPKGTKVTGGGAYATGANDQTFLNMTRPWDSGDKGKRLDNGWQVKASNVNGAKKDLTAYAICRPNLSPKPFLAFGGIGPGGSAGVGQGCKSDVFSASGAGGAIKGEGSLIRISAAYPDDNSIEAGTVPDDVVIMEGENLTGQTVDAGPAGVCVR